MQANKDQRFLVELALANLSDSAQNQYKFTFKET